MAPPGRQSGEAGNQRQIQMQRQIATDEVLDETPNIVTFFIANRMEAQGCTVPEELRVASSHVNTEVATCLRQVGDDLENNHSLNSLIGQIHVTPQTAFSTFADVATKIFADGVYNWGRIIALLYFGFKLALSVIRRTPLVQMVLDWVVRFLRERLVSWIAEQGGWSAIKEYATSRLQDVRGASTPQLVSVAVVGLAVAFIALNRP